MSRFKAEHHLQMQVSTTTTLQPSAMVLPPTQPGSQTFPVAPAVISIATIQPLIQPDERGASVVVLNADPSIQLSSSSSPSSSSSTGEGEKEKEEQEPGQEADQYENVRTCEHRVEDLAELKRKREGTEQYYVEEFKRQRIIAHDEIDDMFNGLEQEVKTTFNALFNQHQRLETAVSDANKQATYQEQMQQLMHRCLN